MTISAASLQTHSVFNSESEAGGCIIFIAANLPKAYDADSSVAGCIFSPSLSFSLIQNIFSLLCFDTVHRQNLAERLPLQQTGSDTLFIGKSAMSDHAKTLEKPRHNN